MENHKFIRQPDAVSCGPTAIANALIFFNKIPPTVGAIKKLCKTNKKVGTLSTSFTKTLKMAFKGVGKVECPKRARWRKAFRAMFEGNGVCVLYRDPMTSGGHYAFCFMKEWTFYVVNNDYELICEIDYFDLKAVLKDKWTEVWIVTLNQKTSR